MFRGNSFKSCKEGHRPFECPIGRIATIVNEDEVQENQPKQGESFLA